MVINEFRLLRIYVNLLFVYCEIILLLRIVFIKLFVFYLLQNKY